jgi:lipid-A-disaccharide synthase-like uncharacterized protein
VANRGRHGRALYFEDLSLTFAWTNSYISTVEHARLVVVLSNGRVDLGMPGLTKDVKMWRFETGFARDGDVVWREERSDKGPLDRRTHRNVHYERTAGREGFAQSGTARSQNAMSSTVPPDPETLLRRRVELHPPAFGTAFDKARKTYGLFSGLLMAWALVGVDLKEEPLTSVKLTLKSPQAAPYVLVALVVYFAARFTIEWFQSSVIRRDLLPSRIDFWMAHAIGIGAIGLFAIQKALQVQLANLVFAEDVVVLLGTVFSAVSFGLSDSVATGDTLGLRPRRWLWSIGVASVVLLSFIELRFAKHRTLVGRSILQLSLLVVLLGISHFWSLRTRAFDPLRSHVTPSAAIRLKGVVIGTFALLLPPQKRRHDFMFH